MTSTNFFDRLMSPHMRSPILPLHQSPTRSPSEYQLDRLSPRPDDASSLDDGLPRAWADDQDVPGTPRRPSSGSWRDKATSPESLSKMKPRAMFAGPPPPITASMLISRDESGTSRNGSPNSGRGVSQTHVRRITPILGSMLLDQRPETATLRSDSRWRGLRRQEKALEKEVQQLLDYQAAGLIAGSGGVNDSLDSDADVRSDGSSTPTGTFYSTKSSKSRMTASLYVPTRETADGNVLPVRQPAKERPLGLRATRAGLRKSIMAMVRLKQEEDTYLEAALVQRKKALDYLQDLSARRIDIRTELDRLDDGGDEPLGQEVSELGVKCDTLDKEIQLLEERLVAMRNRRRWLREKMDDVKNKREAGLSGYRGALKEVDAEVATFMRRPPIQPLDPDILDHPTSSESSGGDEFLQLVPDRRTLDMAKSWWEKEISALESRRLRIDSERQALQDGGTVWETVMQLVSNFESSLRQVMKPPPLSPSAKGKEKMLSQEETIQNQLPQMKKVMDDLQRHMSMAEEKRWNLLICAIGAELEAFREAYDVLESLVGNSEGSHIRSSEDSHTEMNASDQHGTRGHSDESDNEVPQDLLGAQSGDDHDEADDVPPQERLGSESENEVPSEFLAEHESQ